MNANEALRQKVKKKKKHDAEEERKEGRTVSHGDGLFGGFGYLLIDDLVAILT